MRLRESARALASRCSAEILAGRYRLDAVIGSGGAADVHRGFDLRLRRPVAVKVFRPGIGVETEHGFESEAVILARLQHPGLVTAYDAGRHDDRAYLVMQLIEGPTLKGRIAEGPLRHEDTAALGAALAQALAHAHEAGIVHRDVKPSNILLDASGRPHLTDFGISRLVDATTRTATGALVGTAAYMSPEQVLGRCVGPPADVYALGLVLLECLTGRLEYDGGPLEAAIARLHRRPVLPSSLPAELADLLRKMTAQDEHVRPSAPDCARTLAALAGPALTTPALASAGGTTPLVGGGERTQDGDATHRNPLPAPARAAAKPAPARATAKPAPARGRALVAGGTVALAAVMAAALPVGDGHRGGDGKADRAVSRTTGTSEGPAGTPTRGTGTSPAPAAPPSTARGASAEALRATAPEHSSRPAPDRSSRPPARSTGIPHDGTPAGGAQAGAAQAGTDRAVPGQQQPGEAEKPGGAQKADGAEKPGTADRGGTAEKKAHKKPKKQAG
ncbi:serine/threonine-protein kinase [Streptomyces sp. NPDC006193]|uniref:serine/threonine-protein kinase n=1 Tax=Streptomyces sp. NPDC006193 TaxID=3155717 RepID=UPI0033B3B6BA